MPKKKPFGSGRGSKVKQPELDPITEPQLEYFKRQGQSVSPFTRNIDLKQNVQQHKARKLDYKRRVYSKDPSVSHELRGQARGHKKIWEIRQKHLNKTKMKTVARKQMIQRQHQRANKIKSVKSKSRSTRNPIPEPPAPNIVLPWPAHPAPPVVFPPFLGRANHNPFNPFG